MVYTIGFGMRNSPDVLSVIERNTAREALELAEALEQRDEEIRQATPWRLAESIRGRCRHSWAIAR